MHRSLVFFIHLLPIALKVLSPTHTHFLSLSKVPQRTRIATVTKMQKKKKKVYVNSFSTAAPRTDFPQRHIYCLATLLQCMCVTFQMKFNRCTRSDYTTLVNIRFYGLSFIIIGDIYSTHRTNVLNRQ